MRVWGRETTRESIRITKISDASAWTKRTAVEMVKVIGSRILRADKAFGISCWEGGGRFAANVFGLSN